MKKFITSMFAMATLLTASAQMASGVQARVYAYNLQQEVDTESKDVTSYKITFQTNCAANEGEAYVLLMQDGEEVYRIPAEATDNTLKNWEAVVDVYTVQEIAGNVEAGDYNWSVEVAAGAVTKFQLISDHSDISNKGSVFRFFRSFGLCVDKSPESEYFGRTYVVNQATGSDYKPRGMYVYNPALDLSMSVEANLTTGVLDMIGRSNSTTPSFSEPTSGSAPTDMCISKDGRLFMTNTTSTFYGIYYIDPVTFNNTSVFSGTKRKTDEYGAAAIFDSNGNRITGIRSGVTTMGYGENTTLMVSESLELYAASSKKLYSCPMNFFEIGTSNTWNAVPSYTLSPTASGAIKTREGKNVVLNRGMTTFEGTTNGFWAVQTKNRFASTSDEVGDVTNTPYGLDDTNPYLFYYSSKSGFVEYTNFEVQPNHSPALGANDELGLVAMTKNGTPNPLVMKYTEDEESGKITIVSSETFTTSNELSSKADAIDIDYAGNLWAVTSYNEKLAVYALPDALVGENKRVTPAKSDLLVKLTAEDITTGIVEVGVDADAAVEYYNLQGVKVENPSNGIFIKKQGNKTTKVVL